jgi:uncharacterized membrane protein YhhN
MTTAIILTALMYVSLGFLLYYKNRDENKPILIFKTLTSLLFIGIALAGALYKGFGVYSIMMIIGFVMCTLGDVLILNKKNTTRFISAILAFLLGHVFFASAFCAVFGYHWLDAVLIVVIMCIAFYVYKSQKFSLGKFLYPVAGYAFVITVMLVKAVSVIYLGNHSPLFTLAVSLGAAMFFASDAILVFLVFKKFSKKGSAINLILYYTGQALLALSILAL